MKKLLLSLMAVTVAAATAFAATVTDELTNANTVKGTGTTYSTYTVSSDNTNSGAEYSLQCAGGSGTIQLRSSNNNSGIVSKTSGGTLVSVTVTWNSSTVQTRVLNIYASNTKYTAPTALYGNSVRYVTQLKYSDAVNGVSTYTFTGDYEYIGIRSNSGAIYLDKVEIAWEKPNETGVATPSITCTDNEVTMSCATEGAEIYYTTGEAVPDENSTKYEAPIAITETTTFNAIAIKDGEKSEVRTVVAKFVKTEFNSFAEMFAEGNGATGKINGPLVAYVDEISGSSHYLYLKDATGGFGLAYNNNKTGEPYANGTTFESITGTVGTYGGLPQLTNYTLGTESEGTALEPTVYTLANIAEAPNAAYCKLEGVTITTPSNLSFTITQDGNTLAGRDQFGIDFPTNVSLKYDLVGIYTSYNGTPQFQPVSIVESAEEQEPVEAFVTNPAAEDEIIKAMRGTTVTFTSAHAAKIEYTVEIDGQDPVTGTVENDAYTLSVTEACTVELISYDAEGNKAFETTYMIEIEASPLCTNLTFDPADGSTISAGTEIKVKADNAVKYEYMIQCGDDLSDAVIVEGEEAFIAVTTVGSATLHIVAYNIDGEDIEGSATYTVTEAPKTGSANFDFTGSDVLSWADKTVKYTNDTNIGATNDLNGVTFTSDNGVKISFTKGTEKNNGIRLWHNKKSGDNLRIYLGCTMTISAPADNILTSITLTKTDSENIVLTPSTGNLDATTYIWTPGEAAASSMRREAAKVNSVVFTAGATTQIDNIGVDYAYDPTMGINNVSVEDADAPVEYYNLQGVRVENPANGLYIRRQGTTVTKVLVR